ncbi:hypothetical protein [Streptomyces sp. NPDC055210]
MERGVYVADANTDMTFEPEPATLGEGHPWESPHGIAEEGRRLPLRQPRARSAVFAGGGEHPGLRGPR